MNCRTVQRWLDDLADGRIAGPQADQMRQHIAECTDCRVFSQRTARVQRLIALKRYEQPAPNATEQFLAEFHQRLAAITQRPSWGERLAEGWTAWLAGGWPIPRLALAGVAALFVVTGVAFTVRQRRQTAPATVVLRTPSVTNAPAQVLAVAPVTGFVPQPQLTVAVPANPAMAVSEPAPVFAPAAVRLGERSPRYVLDRLTITPASYDGPNVQF